jgi:hypothetical protein
MSSRSPERDADRNPYGNVVEQCGAESGSDA